MIKTLKTFIREKYPDLSMKAMNKISEILSQTNITIPFHKGYDSIYIELIRNDLIKMKILGEKEYYFITINIDIFQTFKNDIDDFLNKL